MELRVKMEESKKKKIIITALKQYRESCRDSYIDLIDDNDKTIDMFNMDDDQVASYNEVIEINKILEEYTTNCE